MINIKTKYSLCYAIEISYLISNLRFLVMQHVDDYFNYRA